MVPNKSSKTPSNPSTLPKTESKSEEARSHKEQRPLDVLAGAQILPKGGWEQFHALLQDPGLHAEQVTIGARVTFRKMGSPDLRIVFKKGEEETGVECVHVGVYAGLLDTLPPDENLARSSEHLTVSLSPEEHFFALNSYVAGIAELGLGTMFAIAQEAANLSVGFNALMQEQIIKALYPLASTALLDILLKAWDVNADQTGNIPPNLLLIIESIIWNPMSDPEPDNEIYFSDATSGLAIRKNYKNILQPIFEVIPPLLFFEKNRDLLDLLRVPDIFNLIKEFYGHDSEVTHLQVFLNSPTISCQGCGRSWLTETYFRECESCNAFVCSYCHDTCSECEGDLCTLCKTKYESCNDNGNLCKDCVKKLSCGHISAHEFDDDEDDDEEDYDPVERFRNKENGSLIMCDEPDCKTLLCDHCAEECVCGSIFCNTHARDHIGECYICHGKACLQRGSPYDHSVKSECVVCGQVVCEKDSEVFYNAYRECHLCAEKCDFCGNYALDNDWMYFLNTCHYCGRKICHSADGGDCYEKGHAFECDECGIYFCEKCENKHLKDYPEHDFILAIDEDCDTVICYACFKKKHNTCRISK